MWYNRTELRTIKHWAYCVSKIVWHLNSIITESYNKCSETNYQTNDDILLQQLLLESDNNKLLNDCIVQRGCYSINSKLSIIDNNNTIHEKKKTATNQAVNGFQ